MGRCGGVSCLITPWIGQGVTTAFIAPKVVVLESESMIHSMHHRNDFAGKGRLAAPRAVQAKYQRRPIVQGQGRSSLEAALGNSLSQASPGADLQVGLIHLVRYAEYSLT